LKTCFTAIFGAYDDLKPCAFKSQHWKYVCYTDQDLEIPDGSPWEIIKVPVMEFDGVPNPAKTARWYKINFHKHIETEFSLWVDATFFINCDLNRWWRRFQIPMTCVTHPFDDCIYTDFRSCISGKKGDFFKLIQQASDYKLMGIPEHNGLIASGILMRQNTREVRQICDTWWGQVEKYTERDQIAFGYASFKHPGVFNTIRWNYTDPHAREFMHCPHLHKEWRSARKREIEEKIKHR
jgi:hypothetical protein